MYSAYELLPATVKAKIEGKRAVHNLDFSRTRRHGEDLLTTKQKSEVPPVAHPIVRTHPETGARRFSWAIMPNTSKAWTTTTVARSSRNSTA